MQVVTVRWPRCGRGWCSCGCVAARSGFRFALPPDVQAEILRINKEARDRSLQVALLVPLLASLLGVLNAFRMRRLKDPTPSEAVEGLVAG